jgi:diguanylate cyclase (GGDEF)-like protein
MRRVQLRSPKVWLPLAGSLLIAVLLVLQFVEFGSRGARRIGIDIDEEAAQLHVARIERASPAASSGILEGDRLVAIDGVSLFAIEDFDRLADSFHRGTTIEVTLERDGVLQLTELRPGMPATWWIYAARALIAAICMFVGSLALFLRSNDVRARLLACIFFLIAFEFSAPHGLGIESAWNVLAPVFFYVVTGLQIAMEFHLALVFPRPDAWPGRRRAAIGSAYGVGFLVAAVGSATYLLESFGALSLPVSVESVDRVIHRVVLPAWALGLTALLIHATVRAPVRRGRLQSALVLLGVLPWAFYILAGWVSRFPDGVPPPAWETVVPLLMLSYPIAVFVAISRYQLFDLEIVVRRGWCYSSLTAVLVGLFYAVLGAGTALFSRFVETGAGSVGSLAASTVVLGLCFGPLRRAVQQLIDRRFFPERDAMRRRLVALAGELPALRDSERMAQHLTRELRRIFGTTFAAVLGSDAINGTVSFLASSGELGTTEVDGLGFEEGWVDRLSRAGKPINAATLSGGGPQASGRTIPRVAVPLRVDRRLVAILVLGEKSKDTRFSREEIELLGLLSHHAAVAFDNARLFRSATYEGLTGLLRRESILELLNKEIERARRHGRPLSVAIVDVDHFKRINDRFGHLEGDRVLQRTARCLSDQLRGTDAVGRYGGEEFLLVFPETDLNAAVELADALRCSIEHMDLDSEQREPIQVRISVGVAALHDSPLSGRDTIPELLDTADRRLYMAKEAGRNRVEPASSSPETDPGSAPDPAFVSTA